MDKYWKEKIRALVSTNKALSKRNPKDFDP